MLQAMNTGHDGSLTTLHANNPRDALSRLVNMVMMAGFDLPVKVIREQIASAVNLIVQQSRLGNDRKIMAIMEITGVEEDNITTQNIFEFIRTGLEPGPDGKPKVQGYFAPTGNIPDFISTMRKNNEISEDDMAMFVPDA